MPSPAVKISLAGFGDLEKALKTIGPLAARKVGAKSMKAAAQPIVDRAKVYVPVDTGLLEESIIQVPVKTNVERELKVQIGFRPPASSRAHFTEFGTSRSRAQPFMRPALDTEAENAIAIMGQEMWKGIAAEAVRAPKGKK